MSTVQGMLSSEQLQTLIEGEEIDTILVVFPDAFHMNSEVSEFARISIACAMGSTIAGLAIALAIRSLDLLVQSHDYNAYATRGRKVKQYYQVTLHIALLWSADARGNRVLLT